MGIEIEMRTHGIENPRALLDQARQDLIDIGDGERIIRSKALDSPLGTGPRSIPRLARSVALPDEQQVFSLRPPGHQDGDRLGFRKSCQIMKVTVLPVSVFDIA